MKPLDHRSISNLDTFVHRRAIYRALVSNLPLLNGIVLDVGCGRMPYRGTILRPPSKAQSYIGLDLLNHPLYKVAPDLTWDGETIPLKSESVDSVLLTEVIEHLPEPDRVLLEINRVLRPQGLIFFTVPFLWPLHDVPYDEFRYTPFSLTKLLVKGGFSRITMKALGCWDSSLAQLLGLWVMRRPMNAILRRGLACILFPVIYLLSNKDETDFAFSESLMITGLAGTAIKN